LTPLVDSGFAHGKIGGGRPRCGGQRSLAAVERLPGRSPGSAGFPSPRASALRTPVSRVRDGEPLGHKRGALRRASLVRLTLHSPTHCESLRQWERSLKVEVERRVRIQTLLGAWGGNCQSLRWYWGGLDLLGTPGLHRHGASQGSTSGSDLRVAVLATAPLGGASKYPLVWRASLNMRGMARLGTEAATWVAVQLGTPGRPFSGVASFLIAVFLTSLSWPLLLTFPVWAGPFLGLVLRAGWCISWHVL